MQAANANARGECEYTRRMQMQEANANATGECLLSSYSRLTVIGYSSVWTVLVIGKDMHIKVKKYMMW